MEKNKVDNKGKSGIYILKFKNIVYVWSSINLYRRLNDHFNHLRRNCHRNKHLQNYYNKYTDSMFDWEIIEFCEIPLLKEKEDFYIEKFDSFNKGEVVYVPKEEFFYKTGMTLGFIPHTDTTIWEQVENPNLVTDKETEQVINNNSEIDNSINNGGKTDYYQLKNAPFLINDFDDFAEWRGLNGSQFNMGKAMWTFNTGRHSGTNYERDLNKIIHYANRELLRLKRGEK